MYVDSDHRPDLVKRYGIVDLPTLMFFTPEGGLISRMENEFKDSAVERVLAGIDRAKERAGAIRADLERWKRALDAAPDGLEPNQKLGAIYYQLKQPERALPYLDRAVALDPKLASPTGPWTCLAATFLHLQGEDWVPARSMAEAFLAALPTHAEAPQMRYYLGVTLYHTGGDEQARAEWRAVIERHPGSEWAAKAKKALELPAK